MEEIERLRTNLSGFMTASLPELNRMVDKQFEENIIESVLEELVEIAVVGQEECAAQAQVALARTYRNISERRKEDIIRWVFEYTEKNIEDTAIFFLGFNFLLKLKWKELFIPYIELYGEALKNEFDDDYIQFYEIEQYLK